MGDEKTFEKKVKDFLNERGCWVLKTWSNGIQRQGVPDLLVCCNGYFLGIELKQIRGRASKLQEWNIESIRNSGGIAFVLFPNKFEELKTLVGLLERGDYLDAREFQLVFDKK